MDAFRHATPSYKSLIMPRVSRPLSAVALGALLLSGCDLERAPAALKLELPPVVVSTDPARAAVRLTDADGRKSLGTKEYAFSVTPGSLASVDRRGNVICQKSGDGAVEVVVSGVRASSPLRCRLVERIEAPAVGRVELDRGPFVPAVRVLGKGGAELTDVTLTLSSKSSGVLYPKDSQLVPKSVGSAVIVARAGQAFIEFPVDVVRRVTVEALPIDANRKINFSLDAGKYELGVKLPVRQALESGVARGAVLRLLRQWTRTPLDVRTSHQRRRCVRQPRVPGARRDHGLDRRRHVVRSAMKGRLNSDCPGRRLRNVPWHIRSGPA